MFVSAFFGGTQPPPLLPPFSVLQVVPDPVDCVLTAWSPFTDCTATCGGGIQTRSRSVDTLPLYGGEPCSTALSQSQSCNADPCAPPSSPGTVVAQTVVRQDSLTAATMSDAFKSAFRSAVAAAVGNGTVANNVNIFKVEDVALASRRRLLQTNTGVRGWLVCVCVCVCVFF